MEKDLRKAMGADSLVLGASRPQSTIWFRKDAGRCVEGESQSHRADPVQEWQGGHS
jgi:hypothetical protein